MTDDAYEDTNLPIWQRGTLPSAIKRSKQAHSNNKHEKLRQREDAAKLAALLADYPNGYDARVRAALITSGTSSRYGTIETPETLKTGVMNVDDVKLNRSILACKPEYCDPDTIAPNKSKDAGNDA